MTEQSVAIKAGETRRFIEVIDPVPVLDSGRFEAMQRIASIMARSSLTPDCLRTVRVVDDDGKPLKDEKGRALHEQLPYENILANCFLVTNQAVRWGLDPFAIAQCVSVVGGKLCYEGKLVAAVLDAKLGIELSYEWNSEKGDAYGVVVSGRLPHQKSTPKTVKGTVGEWKTDRYGSPWKSPSNHTRMLAYRGAREWARIHKPSIMLGVYTDDEMEALEARPRSITPVQHALGKPRDDSVAGRSWSEGDTLEKPLEPPLPPPSQVQRDFMDSLPEMAARIGFSSPPPSSPQGAGEAAEVQPPTDPTSAATDTHGSPAGPTLADHPMPPMQASTPASESSDGSTTMNSEGPDGGPTDDASYQAHVFAWVAQMENRKEAIQRFNSERALRNTLHISMNVVDRCKAFLVSAFP